jgi:hypothetical protein
MDPLFLREEAVHVLARTGFGSKGTVGQSSGVAPIRLARMDESGQDAAARVLACANTCARIPTCLGGRSAGQLCCKSLRTSLLFTVSERQPLLFTEDGPPQQTNSAEAVRDEAGCGVKRTSWYETVGGLRSSQGM